MLLKVKRGGGGVLMKTRVVLMKSGVVFVKRGGGICEKGVVFNEKGGVVLVKGGGGMGGRYQ